MAEDRLLGDDTDQIHLDATEFGRRLTRRFQFGLALTIAVLALLVSTMSVGAYLSVEEDIWSRAEERLQSYAAQISSCVRLAAHQVTRAQAAFQHGISAGGAPLGLRESEWTRAAGAAAKEPFMLASPIGDGGAHLLVVAAGDVRGNLGQIPHSGFLSLVKELELELGANPDLLQAGVIGLDGVMILISRRRTPIDELISSQLANGGAVGFDAALRRDLASNALAAGPAVNPKREIVWTGPYLGDGYDRPLLSARAPIYVGDDFAGAILMIYAAEQLLATDVEPPVGDFYLAGATSVDRISVLATGGLEASASESRRRDLVEKFAQGSAWSESRSGDERMIAAGIDGTPWRLMLIAPASAALEKSLPNLLLTALALLFLAAIAIHSMLSFRRTYLRPALSLIEVSSASAGRPLADLMPPLWRPLARMVDDSRAKAARYVASLEDQNRMTNAVLASAIDCIITADAEGRIVDFNPAAERVFGWTREEAIGKTLEEMIIPHDLRAAHREGMRRHIETGSPRALGRRAEMRGLKRDGTEFPMELVIAETKHNDARVFIGYMRDLTDREKAEIALARSREALHQAEKLAALGSLLAGVAHELNNPLAVVVGRAAILEEKLADTPHAAPLAKLRAAADRCSRIVKTFLAMARQSGPRRTMVDLNELIEGAVDMTAYGLRSAGVDLQLELQPNLPQTYADGDQLIQALINLLINAQHALEKHTGRRRVIVRSKFDSTTRKLFLTVEDSGPGVPRGIASRIFDPFFTTKEVGSGTGIGLSVCKGMIEANGGSIALREAPGGGASFTVVLSLVAHPPESDDKSISAHGGVQRAALVRTLIVDDEPEIAALLADCLTPLGMRCDFASDGAEALAKIAKHNYGVVLSDVRMPGMDGVALLKELSNSRPDLVQRFAFISGHVLNAEGDATREFGGRPVVEKPFSPQQVRAVASALLK